MLVKTEVVKYFKPEDTWYKRVDTKHTSPGNKYLDEVSWYYGIENSTFKSHNDPNWYFIGSYREEYGFYDGSNEERFNDIEKEYNQSMREQKLERICNEI